MESSIKQRQQFGLPEGPDKPGRSVLPVCLVALTSALIFLLPFLVFGYELLVLTTGRIVPAIDRKLAPVIEVLHEYWFAFLWVELVVLYVFLGALVTIRVLRQKHRLANKTQSELN